MADYPAKMMMVFGFQFSVFSLMGVLAVHAAEPLPLSASYWSDPAFLKSFNGSYRIEARIEPVVSTEERGVLVEVQKLMEDGKREAALEKIQKSALTKESPALQFNLGNIEFEEGKLDEAQKSFESAIEAYPSFRRAHRNLGLVHVRKNELEEALEHLLEAMRLGDSDGTTYGLVGYCRLQRGEWASALQAYRMAQLSQPESTQWKAGVAQCLQNLDARVEAVVLLDEVIRQRPEESSYALLQASMLMELERNEDAVKALELPRRLGRLDPDGLLLLADLHLRAERPELASSLVDEAFGGESKPGVGQVLSTVGSAMKIRAWDVAGGLIEKSFPEEGEAPRSLRRAAARLDIESGRDPDRGASSLKVLIAEDPVDGPALLALGKHVVSTGDSGSAELLLERATAVEETAVDAWIELARLNVDQRRYAKALDAVDQALVLRPGGELQSYRDSLANLVAASE
jgi:tetratricopeptide (TPR) repeat protein